MRASNPDSVIDGNLHMAGKDAIGALYWRSRRGLTEVELKLVPFFERCFKALPEADRQAYARLLEREDWQLHDWLQGRSEPDEPHLARIVGLIRRFGRDQP